MAELAWAVSTPGGLEILGTPTYMAETADAVRSYHLIPYGDGALSFSELRIEYSLVPQSGERCELRVRVDLEAHSDVGDWGLIVCLDPDFYDGELGDSGDFDVEASRLVFDGSGWTGARLKVGAQPAFSAWEVGDVEEILEMVSGGSAPVLGNTSRSTGSGSEQDAAGLMQWTIPAGAAYSMALGLDLDLSADGGSAGSFETWLDSFGILKSGETTPLSGSHWFEISGSGEAIVLGDDEVSEAIALPFEFDFFGEKKSEVRVSADGWLVFGDGVEASQGTSLESGVDLPDEFVALFAADLDPSAGGAIYFQSNAESFIVQFQDVPLAGGIEGDYLTAQVMLTRGGDVLFSYREVPFADEVVVGMQGADGLSRVLVEDVERLADREQTFGLEQGDALRLDRDSDGDGRTDFGEFCFGGDPTVPDAVEVLRFVEGLGSGEVVVEFPRRRDLGDGSVAVDYRIEAGGGDGSWRTVGSGGDVVGERGDFEVVRVTLGDVGVRRELLRVVARLEEVAGAATLEVGSAGVEVGRVEEEEIADEVVAEVLGDGRREPDDWQEPEVVMATAHAGVEIKGAERLDTPEYGDEVTFDKSVSAGCESKIGQEFDRLLQESDVLESALAAIMQSVGIDESSRSELLGIICQSIDQQGAVNGYEPQPNDVYKFSFGPQLNLELSKNFGATAYSTLLFSAGANFNVDWVPGQWVQYTNKIAFTIGTHTLYGGIYLKMPIGAYAATDKIEVGLSFSHQSHSPKVNAGPNFAGFFEAGITWNHNFSSGTTNLSTELEVRDFVRLMGVSDFSGGATKLLFPGFYQALEYLGGNDTDSVEVMSISLFQNLWRIDRRTDNIIGILLHSRFDIIHETGNGGVDLWLELSAGIPLILPAELVSYAIPFPTPRAQLVGGIGFHRSWPEELSVLAEDVEGWNLVFDELDAIDWIASQGIELFSHQFGWSEIDEDKYRVAFDNGIRDSMDASAVHFNPLSDVVERSFWVHGAAVPGGFERRFDGGLGGIADSAPNTALKYFTGGRGWDGDPDGAWKAEHRINLRDLYEEFDVDGNKVDAFYRLGHVASLLIQQSFPDNAHGNPESLGGGYAGQASPYKDWVVGNQFRKLFCAQFDNKNPVRYGTWDFESSGPWINVSQGRVAFEEFKLRSPDELDPARVYGDGSARILPDSDHYSAYFSSGSRSIRPLYGLFGWMANEASKFDGVEADGWNDMGLRRDGQVSFCALSDYDNWTEGELNYVADRMVPNAIRGVGELLRVFYKYADVVVGPTVTWRIWDRLVEGSPEFPSPREDTGAIQFEVRLEDNGNGIDSEETYIEWRGEPANHAEWQRLGEGDGRVVTGTEVMDWENNREVLIYRMEAVFPVDKRIELRIVSSDGAGNPIDVDSDSSANQETIALVVGGNGPELLVEGTAEGDFIEIREDEGDGAVYAYVNGSRKFRRNASVLELITIKGLAGDDKIWNYTDFPSEIDGGDGRDIIHGGEGADLIYGGKHKDRIFGHGGDDWLFGEGAGDIIKGGDGKDYIDGGKGLDKLRGEGEQAINDREDAGRPGGRNDHIVGGRGRDRIWGNAGRDLIFGGTGSDRIRGGIGGDRIYGGRGEDVIRGESGWDEIAGGEDKDTIDGEEGNDTIAGGDGGDIIDGGVGDDVLWGDFNVVGFGAPSFEYPEGERSMEGTNWDGGFPDDSGEDTVRGGDDVDHIYGGKGDDDELNGGRGGDFVFGDEGDDHLYGGDGDGEDYLYGGAGEDSIYGEGGIDWIYGGDDNGDKWLDGGEGGDHIWGGSGADVIRGEGGEDHLYGQGGADDIDGGDRSDWIYGGEDGDSRLYGGEGPYRDRIYGEGGGDRISGGEGDDILKGGDGDDYIEGGDGNDKLWGENDNDVLDGGDDDDDLWGGEGVDDLKGNDGDDELWVERGDGELYDGGRDDDEYFFSGSQLGENELRDSGGYDTLDFSQFSAGGIDFERGDSDRINLRDGQLTIKYPASVEFEKVVGTPFDDRIYKEAIAGDRKSSVRIEGLGGDDELYARFGDCALIGGSGDDYLDYQTKFVLVGGPTFADKYEVYLGGGDVEIEGGNGDDQISVWNSRENGGYSRISPGGGSNQIRLDPRDVGLVDLSEGTGTFIVAAAFCGLGGRVVGWDGLIGVGEPWESNNERYTILDQWGDKIWFDYPALDCFSRGKSAFGVEPGKGMPKKGGEVKSVGGEDDEAGAVTCEVSQGVVTVVGRVGDDRIVAKRVEAGYQVEINSELWDVGNGVERFILRGRGGDDEIINDTGLPALIFGGRGDDRLVGGSGRDVIHGGAGADVIFGGDGDDLLEGGDGDDVIGGGDGDDLLSGGYGNDELNGRRGDDELVGAGGADVLVGGEGRDQHDGGAGNDTIDTRDGVFGNDHVVAGIGRDTVRRDRPVVPPLTAVEDRAVTLAGEPVNIRVLQNDIGGGRGSVAVKEVTDGEFGTVDPLDGAHPNVMVYTPDPGFVGLDEFTYVIGDGSGQESDADVLVEVLDPGQVAITRAPVLMAPKHRRTDVRRLATFVFSRMRKPTEYVLRLYEPGAAAPWRTHVIPSPPTGPVEFTIPGEAILPGLTTMQWTVTGRNAAGLGPESERWTMTTRRALVTEAPEIASPGEGETVDPEEVVLRFSNPEAATGFRVRLFRDDENDRVRLVEVDASPGGETVWRIPAASPLRGNRQYWVAVLPLAGDVEGPVSRKVGFRTGPKSIEGVPRLVSPKERPGVALQPVFKVENLATADAYEFVLYEGTETNEIARQRVAEGADGFTRWDYGTVGELKPATPHWWTAAGVNSAGEVGGFADPRLFRTDGNEALDTELREPIDGTQKASVLPTFQWVGGADAVRWNLWVFEAGSEVPVRAFHNLSSQEITMPGGQELAGEQAYEWTVQGIGLGAAQGDPPPRYSFTTLLPAPVPTSPAGRIVINDQRPTFRWTPVAGASKYELRVRRGTFDGTVVYEYDGNATSHQVRDGEELGANTFFWDVRAWGKKDPGAWSIQGVFTISTAPNNPPQLLRPADGSELRRVATEFEWEGNPQAMWWELEVVRVADGERVFHDDRIPGRVFRIPAGRELWGDRLHDYRVRAWNDLGPGPWSGTWRFRTGMPESALIAPVGGVEVNTQLPVLQWQVVNGANRYSIEVKKGTASGDLVYEATVEAEGSKVIPDSKALAVGSDYVWRVCPHGPTVNGFFTNWGKFSVRTAPRNPTTLENPEHRAIDRPVKPMLRWSGNPQATGFEIEVYDAGDLVNPIIRRTVNGVREYHITGAETLGNYQTVHWKVRAVNDLGAGPWSATWRFTTRLGKPVPVAPSSGVAINTRVPTFKWSPVTGATGYSLQVRQALTTGTIVYSAEVTGTSQKVPGTSALPVGGTIFWKVQAKGAGEQRGDWSDWGSFPIRTAPIDEPELTSPRDDATGVSTTPLLKWDGTPQSTSYDVRVYRVANGELEYSRDGLTAEQVQIPSSSELWGDRLHDVILRGRNEIGAGDWSEPSRFRTLIRTPGHVSPAKGVTISEQRPTLTWGTVPGANSYTVEVRRGGISGTVVHRATVSGTSSRVGSDLGANNTYYWRLRANGPQNPSAWSTNWTFTIETAPNNPPTLVAPANNAVDRTVRPVFKWEGNPQATHWEIEVFRLNTPTDVRRHYPVVTSREFRVPVGDELQYNRSYLWRVRAHNALGDGPWSGKWEFKTKAQ